MAGFGSYYKGEKKKQKKGKAGQKLGGDAPVFTMPEIIPKKKREW